MQTIKKFFALMCLTLLFVSLPISTVTALEKSSSTTVNKAKNKVTVTAKKEKTKKVSKQKKEVVKKADRKIIVYYFHSNYRCSNCYKIEQYSKEAVEIYFTAELKSGIIEYRIINYDQKENAHYIKDYGLYTKSLFVTLVENGREIKSKNLTGVWNYLYNKDEFYNYVKSEIDQYLSEAKQ